MEVALWIWLVTIAGIVGLLALSFVTHAGKPHEPSVAEAGAWTGFFVSLSVLFGLGVMWLWTVDHGVEFFAGYVTEYSLSIDNLFVFVIIMGSFSVPRVYQEKVLLVGIAIALILRTVFILIGGAAIARFGWVFYLFGLFLIITAVKLLFEGDDEDDTYKPNFLVRTARRLLPFTEDYDGAALTTRVDGRRLFTPMMMVMIAIGMTDILFALDSIPAIYGLTDVPYIVFATNAFALLGMIELYFLIGGLLKRLVYLNIGLAGVLGFIGVKLVIEAMHGNDLAFINSGESVTIVPMIPTWLSLVIIVAILMITTLASLFRSWLDMRRA